MLHRVRMDGVARIVDFPYKICELGTVRSLPQQNNHFVYEDKMEVTLRLSSGAELAEDIIDGKPHSTPFPNVVIKQPGMSHRYSVEESREAVYFSYPAEQVEALRKVNLLPEGSIQLFELTPRLKYLVRQMIGLMEKSRNYGVADRIDLLGVEILEELKLQGQSESMNDNRSRIMQLASYLQINFTEDLDLDELAHKFSFSRRTMFRHWANYFQMSPVRYITNLKVEEAKRLLFETEMDIASISEYLNFNEITYFCTVFKKETGFTPNEYRKQEAIKKVDLDN
ncbi:MAG: helix-turn-helix transcriptional regulator [Planctomycetes bacterium]|nr:helix-turn-helix transcriptional regulator [Planctomycetota bacterium]